MKNKHKKGLKTVVYVLIILFAFVFLFMRIIRPLLRYKHHSTVLHIKNQQAEKPINQYTYVTDFKLNVN